MIDLASGSMDQTIKIWNIKDFSLKLTINTKAVYCLCVLKNGDLSSGHNDSLIIWNNLDWSIKFIYSTNGTLIYSMISLKNGDLATSGCGDSTIKIWNSKSDYTMIKKLLGHNGVVKLLALLNNGDLVSSGNDLIIKVWNANDLSLRLSYSSLHTNRIT